eukprot:3340653-Amphidinium_carterae.2
MILAKKKPSLNVQFGEQIQPWANGDMRSRTFAQGHHLSSSMEESRTSEVLCKTLTHLAMRLQRAATNGMDDHRMGQEPHCITVRISKGTSLLCLIALLQRTVRRQRSSNCEDLLGGTPPRSDEKLQEDQAVTVQEQIETVLRFLSLVFCQST